MSIGPEVLNFKETVGEVLTKLWFFSHVFQASTTLSVVD